MKNLNDYVRDFNLIQSATLLSGWTLRIDGVLFFTLQENDTIYLYASAPAGYHQELQKPQAVAFYSEQLHRWITAD